MGERAAAKKEACAGRDGVAYRSSVVTTLRAVAEEYPTVPLLALGQTMMWDEPMKAVVRKGLDDLGIQMRMILGIHDTDYFSKLPHQQPGRTGYRMLPHNDGATRGFWTSAGEISQLFGSETVITRDRFLSHGVAFDKLARVYPGGREALLDRKTEAWGWRGLAANGLDLRVTAELPLKELAPALLELCRWACAGTLETIACQNDRAVAEDSAKRLEALLAEHVADHEDWTLTAFYRHILGHIYEWLLGYQPEGVQLAGTSDLMTLNRSTASLPRFKFVDMFLNPATRETCEQAYDAAIEDSAIYELAKFGPGALPFDLVIPGMGRGTLRVTDKYVVVMTPHPFFRSLRQPIRSVAELAAFVEDTWGDGVAIVGKAVAFISMMAHEFLFLFHEDASTYVFRTRRMNDFLRRKGIEFAQRPILRIRYETWDSLAAAGVWLRLPPHLAATFGQEEIQAPAFAGRWRSVVDEQRELLEELRKLQRPRDLIRFLAKHGQGSWDVMGERHDKLHAAVMEMHSDLLREQEEIRSLFDHWRAGKAEYSRVEREKGEDFRRALRPLIEGGGPPAEIERQVERRKAEFDVKLALLRQKVRDTRERIAEIRAERRLRVRSEEMLGVHEARRTIEREAELARLRLVRNALLTVDGLTSTNHRPSAWWLPMLSPDGAWFRRVAETAEMYLEPLHSPA